MSRRPRWAVAVSVLALLGAYGAVGPQHAVAASSQDVADPAGDARIRVTPGKGSECEKGCPIPNEPRADVVMSKARYEAGAIVLSITTAEPRDFAHDPEMDAQTSIVTWALDTSGDRKQDFNIEWGADAGALYADLYRHVNNQDTKLACAGISPSLLDGSYSVSIPAKCVGSPSSFNWAGLMQYTRAGAAPAPTDRFPDGDGNYNGPVSLPGTPEPPANPNPPPTGPSNPGPAPTPPPAPRPIVATPVASNEGFWLLGRDGGVFSFGTAQYRGSIGNVYLQKQIVGMAAKPDGSGYWFVASDGGIFAYKAAFWGSTGSLPLQKPIVGMASTPSGNGYWLVASDGGIFAFGDARFFGSTGALKLNRPIVGMAPTPSGKGYWLVASDGGIFAFGDARFFGSTGDITLNQPIVGMASSPTGNGYWFVARDGGVFGFGDSRFLGSALSDNPSPVIGMAATRIGLGYRVARADGSVTSYGSAAPGGGLTGSLTAPIVGITTSS